MQNAQYFNTDWLIRKFKIDNYAGSKVVTIYIIIDNDPKLNFLSESCPTLSLHTSCVKRKLLLRTQQEDMSFMACYSYS